jgi:hypothetical protein
MSRVPEDILNGREWPDELPRLGNTASVDDWAAPAQSKRMFTQSDIDQAAAELEKAERLLFESKKKLARTVLMAAQQQTPLFWKNVLFAQHNHWAGSIQHVAEVASKMGYPYFSWNGCIYWIQDKTWSDTTFTDEAVR